MYKGRVFCADHNVVFVSINYRVGPFGKQLYASILNLFCSFYCQHCQLCIIKGTLECTSQILDGLLLLSKSMLMTTGFFFLQKGKTSHQHISVYLS